jgi:small subunit ribosomal protein S4e
MARGPKKHMKRLNAPKSWMLHKMGGVMAPKPGTGPHKAAESLPLIIGIRNRLKYALTRREVIMICNRRLIEVDGKVRTDTNYPSGFMDVIHIAKTDENFRVIYDEKGRFVLHRIGAEEAKYKLCRVLRVSKAKKATIGRNPFMTGQAATIPFIVTHDGRTIRYPDPKCKVHDSVKFDLATGKITGVLKFEAGQKAMVTKGANTGRVGVIVTIEKHPGSFDIVHMKDKKDQAFATRINNVFVIGDAKEEWISLPKRKGVTSTIMEERAERLSKHEKGRKGEKKAEVKA